MIYIVVTCHLPLPVPDNGDIECFLGDDGEANPGDHCDLTCDDGFEIRGTFRRLCLRDGTWHGTDPSCTVRGK